MKKGAAAGAIVWSAPLLTSTPAFAADTQCIGGSKPCTNYYFCKFDGSTVEEGSDDQCPSHVVEGDLGCSDQTGAVSNGCTHVDATFTGDTSVVIDYSEGSVPIIVQIKLGGGVGSCYEFEWTDANRGAVLTKEIPNGSFGTCTYTATPSGSISNGGMSITVTKSGSCQGLGLSHAGTYFCR